MEEVEWKEKEMGEGLEIFPSSWSVQSTTRLVLSFLDHTMGKQLYWIYSPEGEVVFQGEFETKKDCIRAYTWGNLIQWRGMPSEWWRCKKIKKS